MAQQNNNQENFEQIEFEERRINYLNLTGVDRKGQSQNPGFTIPLSEDEFNFYDSEGFPIYIPKRKDEVDYPEDWEPTPQLKVRFPKGKNGNPIASWVRIFVIDDEAELSYRVDAEDLEQLESIQNGYYINNASLTVSPFEYDNTYGKGVTLRCSVIYLNVSPRVQSQNRDPFYEKYFGNGLGD